jgi:excisionase family DNA binding protein
MTEPTQPTQLLSRRGSVSSGSSVIRISSTGEAFTMPPKALYKVSEAMAALSLSRTVVYELIRAGRLRTVKEGRARLVPASAIAEYVALLEREAA